MALPDSREDLIRHYSFSESDLAIIKQHRGLPNRLGFAVQLCYMRYPGITLAANQAPALPLLQFVARQLRLDPDEWVHYATRDQTRRD